MKHHNKKLLSNKGSGLGVILYGITLLLILLFTAINIVNSKVIENGYTALRDAVMTASSSSVIHLLTTNRENSEGATAVQNEIIQEANYDIYLQLALGYLINRNVSEEDTKKETVVQTGEINNFIKLDHQKVVNSTLALLEDAIVRQKSNSDTQNRSIDISNTEKYKILMFFIEPYRDDNKGEKYFDIVAYGNGDYEYPSNTLIANGKTYSGKTITRQLAKIPVKISGNDDMDNVYDAVQDAISDVVNCTDNSMGRYQIDYAINKNAIKEAYGDTNFRINLNATGGEAAGKIREMETYPHYLIVVKDFALPTIFDGETTQNTGIKSLFTSLSGDGRLNTPMCALNTGKVQRQREDEGWSHR